jgi:protein-tyrosine phosphatase
MSFLKPGKMQKIMFVCSANVCRSAIAEALMRDKVEKNEKLRGKVSVCSCGTNAEEDRHAMYGAIEVMRERGIDLMHHWSIDIDSSNIEGMDLILCAGTEHKEIILKYYPALRETGNVYTLKEYAGIQDGDANISAPHGRNLSPFRQCVAEIEACLDPLIEQLSSLT